MFSALALVTLLVEAAAGYPDWLFRRVGHPVTWIGAIIRVCDDAFNTSAMSDAKRRLMGVVTLAIIVGASVAVGLIITAAVFSLFGPFGSVLILGVIASALVAQRSLHTHVAAVADALDDGGIEAGRMAVSHIVGRDPGSLIRRAYRARRSKAWPRIFPTAWSRRCFGSLLQAYLASSSTKPSTRQTA